MTTWIILVLSPRCLTLYTDYMHFEVTVDSIDSMFTLSMEMELQCFEFPNLSYIISEGQSQPI